MGAHKVHLLALFGLVLSVFSIVILTAQLLLIKKRRKEAIRYEITLDGILKAFRKGSTTSFAGLFILSGFILCVIWMAHSFTYKMFIPFRHCFFVMWHIAVLRHWMYVFDPLGRRINRKRLDICWLLIRVSLLSTAFALMLFVAIPSHEHFSGKHYDSWEFNEVIWTSTSGIILISCCYFLYFLRRIHRSCARAMDHCRKELTESELKSIPAVLSKPVVDLKYLMMQSSEAMYIGYEVHRNAVERCMVYALISIMCAVLQQIFWLVYLAGDRKKLDIFADHNWARAFYYWLPELIPLFYWLWVLSTAKHVFVDENGFTPKMETTDEIIRTSCFAPDEGMGLTLPISEFPDDVDRMSFQQVDMGAHTIKVEKSRSVSRTKDYASYFGWMTDAVLVNNKNFQFSKEGPMAPRQSLRSSIITEKRQSSSLSIDVISAITIAASAPTRLDDGFREVAICCSEMVLLDKLSDIPVASLFSGQVSFVVLSVAAGSLASDGTHQESVWLEVGRSELVGGLFNPDFKVAFTMPRNDSADANKTWRLDIYNVIVRNQNRNIPRFSVEEANLSHSFLAGIAYFSGRDLSDSGLFGSSAEADNATATPSNQFAEFVRPIISAPYDKSILRFGGAISFRVRNLNLYCYSVPMIMSKRRAAVALPTVRHAASLDALERNQSGDGESVPIVPTLPFMTQSYVVRSVARANKPERTVYLREECIESPYAVTVPIAFLNALVSRRTKETAEFGRFIMDMHELDDSMYWLSEALERKILMLRMYSTVLDDLTTKRRLQTLGDFKSSKLKTDHDLRYMAVNLHLQAFTSSLLVSQATTAATTATRSGDGVQDDAELLSHIVTVGAFTAHSLHFKQGGVWQYLNRFQKRKLELSEDAVQGVAEENDLEAPQYASSMDIWHMRDIPIDQEMQLLAQKASERLDVCLSQCLSALVTGFVARIQQLAAEHLPEELDNLCALGILVQFESLLSTQGKENGMLQDMYCTIRCLDCVQFLLHEATEDEASCGADVKMYWKKNGPEDAPLIIDLGVTPSCFAALPLSIREGATIPVVPVMFSVGINELQSLANMSGSQSLQLQEVVNIESLCRLKEYIELRDKLQKGAFDDILPPAENYIEEASNLRLSEVQSPPERPSGASTEDAQRRSSILHILQEVHDIHEKHSADISTAASIEATDTAERNSEDTSSSAAATTANASDKSWGKIRRLRRSILMTEEGRKMTSGMLLLDPTLIEEENQPPQDRAPKESSKLTGIKFGVLDATNKFQLPSFMEQDSDDEVDENDDFARGVVTKSPLNADWSSASTFSNPHGDSTSDARISMSVGSNTSEVELSSCKPSTAAAAIASGPVTSDTHTDTRKRRMSYVPQRPANLPSSASAPAIKRISSVIEGEKEEYAAAVTYNALQAMPPKASLASVGDTSTKTSPSFSVVNPLPRPQSKRLSSNSAVNTIAVNVLFNELNDAVGQSVGAGGKPWQILTLAGRVTRLLEGIRVTSCKSAKDRTGMSVTLEEVSLIRAKYDLDDEVYKELLDTTRSHGVRLRNAEKNVGKAKFAFNTFQRQFLPDEYAPPLCAIGSVQS